MDIWFLVGLIVGLALLGLYWLRLNAKLKQLIRYLRPDALTLPLSPLSRLNRAVLAFRQSHLALEQELASLKQLFEVAPVGFLQVDEENQLLSCNQKACDLLGISSLRLGKPRLLLEIVRSFELDALIEETRQTQQPACSDWVVYPTDADFLKLSQQQPRPLRGYGIPISEGRIGVFLESREEVAVLEQQRDRWISDVAHELKTPLTSIRLVAETLQMRLESPAREWMDRLLKETLRLSSLVQDLLDLNQLQAQPSARLNLKTVDLPRLVQSAWMSLEPLARNKKIQLDYQGLDALQVQVDEARMYRVLINLLDNSIKFSPPQQKISVHLSLTSVVGNPLAQQVYLEVIDAGSGFPEAALPFVFERFFRADPSRTRSSTGSNLRSGMPTAIPTLGAIASEQPSDANPSESEAAQPVAYNSGSGLGLAIVRQIVEAHQGSVKAGNHPDTGGAWLQIFLPWQPS
jgi:two-component system, OmpR family, phosphate regulon sensor histidine kinase PhoR